MTGCRNRWAGFTLTELMAVLVVLGTLGVVAMVKMGGRGRADAAAGLAREVYTRLLQARFTAVSSGVQVLVQLYPGQRNHVLQLQPSQTPGLATADFSGPVTDEVSGRRDALIVAVADTVDTTDGPLPALSNQPVQVIFYPDGTARIPDGSRTGLTIYLADDLLQHRYRVTVLGRTGFARLMDR